jgi:hypothetical protein
VAQAFEHLLERDRALETQSPQTEFRAIQDLGFEFPVAKQNFLARRQFSPGAHKRFPLVVGETPREQNLDSCGEMLAARARRLARLLRAHAGATPEQSRRYYSRVVYDEQFVAAK